jgi:hypothetical protein
VNYQELKSAAPYQHWAATLLEEINIRNQAILNLRQARLDQREGINVGDFILVDGDKVMRVAHCWDDTIQPTISGCDASFYMCPSGGCSMSGSLDRGISRERFQATNEKRAGSMWFFSEEMASAHNGYHTTAMFRVWILVEETSK